MYPFSYTGLKIVHEQKIQEALQQQSQAQEHQPRPGIGTLLARFTHRPTNAQKQCSPDYAARLRTEAACRR